MEWTPVPVASFLLLHAGNLAHPAARLGALALLMLLGAAAASVTAAIPTRSGRALIATVLFSSLPVVLFGGHIDASLLLMGAGYFFSLLVLSIRHRPVDGRREFLQRSLIVLGGAFCLLALSAAQPVLDAVVARRLFAFRRPVGLPVPGLAEPVTPAGEFYVMDKVLDYPGLDAGIWRLEVSGRVERSLSLTLSSLMARPAHHRYVTLECVDNPIGGPLVGTALWTGVRVSDLLREVGAAGDTVVFESADNYAESLPIATVNHVDPLITYGMNGETLARSHGYPVRLVVPGLYGFKSVKWLTGLRVVDGAAAGVWALHGWNEMPQIHSTARIDVARRSSADILLAGVAFAGIRGVRAVQVRINGGRWRQAHLGPALSEASWVQWVVRVHCAGPCTAEARTIDGTGRVQSSFPHGTYPAGATGWDSVSL